MRFVPFFAALFALAAPVAAQQPDGPAPGEDVLVVGRAERETKREATEFVRALTSIPGSIDPVARFDWAPLCPAAVGLADAQNAAITARMRRVATAARIPLADAGCRPNALVIVAADKNGMIDALRRKFPAYFLTDDKTMMDPGKQPGPATAWHLRGRLDRSGTPVSSAPGATVSSPITPSRLSSMIRPIFLAAVVVIERDAVVGLTTTQLADYAAMRAYGGADPKRLGDTPTATILTVLDAAPSAQVPVTLTRWDIAFLRALYAVDADDFGPRQRTAMRSRMADEVARSDAGSPEE
ncbi:hypothetical protein [Sphingomonas sp. LT1P40]|uniref:hypothetical protein n=1 Tax=Alteristakelama amylovorans TaxID=3096166 RepID=UPI002FCC2E24